MCKPLAQGCTKLIDAPLSPQVTVIVHATNYRDEKMAAQPTSKPCDTEMQGHFDAMNDAWNMQNAFPPPFLLLTCIQSTCRWLWPCEREKKEDEEDEVKRMTL